MGEQLSSQINVADLVGRVNVIDLADFALVKDGVESISSVGGEEVAASVETRAVENEREGLSQERAEFWDDLCGFIASANPSHAGRRRQSLLSGYWCGPYTLLLLTIMHGNLKLFA